MKVPQLMPWIGKEEAKAVRKVIESGWITEGRKSEEFVDSLKKLTGAEYGVLAPNGTLALFLGLLALNIGSGDEVIVPDTTFAASANAVLLTGATPVLAPVNNYNYQIDISKCDNLISEKTKAIMPVHLYGMCADMDSVMSFAKKNNLKVIEDAAQAIGVRYKGKHAGMFGDIGCFSFFADKTITTSEGGFVVCNNKDIYNNLLLLRNQGRIERGSFIHPHIGYNFRMTDMQSAIGLVQLAKLEKIKEKKNEILGWYKEKLQDVGEIKFLELEEGSEYIPFRTVIICERAHDLMDYLARNKIQPRSVFYPLHKQPYFEKLGNPDIERFNLSDERFPNAIYGYEHGVCLPVFPQLTQEQVDYVCSVISNFYNA